MAEKMKPSGIDWIGDIPNNWETSRIKYHYQISLGKMLQPIQENSTDTLEHYMCSANITWAGVDTSILKQMWFSPAEKKQYRLLDGDLLVSEGGDVAVSCIWRNELDECYLQNAVHRVRQNALSDNRFIYYWLFFLKNYGIVDLICNKATIAHFTKEKFGELPICIMSIDEQVAIADFLDKECAQIDSIAADLEKQIALLQQYKKSLVTETVTKGLDKSAPMKDSGVEWIGKIPEHWQKTRIKFEASIIGSGTTPDSGNSMYYDNGEHSWIQSGDLYGKDYIYETEKQLTNLAILECHALNWYTKDFVVVAMYGASVGNVAISKIDSFTNQACCVIKLNEKNDNRYLFYFLKAAQEEMLLKAFGGTQPNISQIIIKNLNFLNVPLLEQIEIADFLDSKCDMINEMLKSKKDQYDILIKHKKSLIYEYVTGKKRVKEVQ